MPTARWRRLSWLGVHGASGSQAPSFHFGNVVERRRFLASAFLRHPWPGLAAFRLARRVFPVPRSTPWKWAQVRLSPSTSSRRQLIQLLGIWGLLKKRRPFARAPSLSRLDLHMHTLSCNKSRASFLVISPLACVSFLLGLPETARRPCRQTRQREGFASV